MENKTASIDYLKIGFKAYLDTFRVINPRAFKL